METKRDIRRITHNHNFKSVEKKKIYHVGVHPRNDMTSQLSIQPKLVSLRPILQKTIIIPLYR